MELQECWDSLFLQWKQAGIPPAALVHIDSFPERKELINLDLQSQRFMTTKAMTANTRHTIKATAQATNAVKLECFSFSWVMFLGVPDALNSAERSDTIA